ncbi:MAG: nitroreductase family protein [Gammaproteobacteria bacterium]|nr:nitroreductase family protein [Gammaproteobacteria bacterium]MDH5591412.1 nitroreductase family protein [Gammaproteobacteria bacterium]
MIEKPAVTDQPIDKILAERWSGRAFDPSLAISDQQITALCEAARWAPSCYGDQPWRFIIWNQHQDKSSWQQALDCLSPGNQEWAKNAPLLVLAASVKTFSHNGQDNRWVGYDTGAASISLCLQATSMGLISHQMGGYDGNKLRAAFALPDDIELWAMIAVGHPAPLDSLNEEHLERELKARERRPLSEQFFSGGWNSPIKSGEQ